MSTFDTFMTHVRPWAPGVSDPAAHKAIRLAAIEFCERTKLWKWEDTFDVTLEDCIGGIFTPAGSVIHDVETVIYGTKELLPRATRDLDRLVPGWRTNETGGGIPAYYTQIDQGTLKLVPAAAGTVTLVIRLKPEQEATDLPDFLGNEYREVIAWGALARLLTVPGQSYSAPDLAAYYDSKFSAKLDTLSTKGTTGQQNAPKRSRARFY